MSNTLTQAVNNRVWARQLFQVLQQFDVEHVCVAPGSRSTPLTLEAAACDNLTLHTHFDERGLGFFGLGLAKTTTNPVAIVVTSGTAVANLLPAVAEANLTGEKLLLLTADRPPELVGVGANQAIVQPGLFSSHVTASVELCCPELDSMQHQLIEPLTQALELQQGKGGAVHINCPFREPLYVEDESLVDAAWEQLHGTLLPRKPLTDEPHVKEFIPHDKGVVVVGSCSLQDAKAAKSFAERIGWPLLCDVQAGINNEFSGFDFWMDAMPSPAFEQATQVVQFGARVVSKRLNLWMVSQRQRQPLFEVHLVSNDWRTIDPNNLGTLQHAMDICLWVEQQAPKLNNSNYLAELDDERSAATTQRKLLDQHLKQCESINEVAIAAMLPSLLDQQDVFVGNSLIVRLLDMFGQWQQREVFSNRGASGIDGLVATASGVQQGRNNLQLTVVGDTSLLYDINSLALAAHSSKPHVVVVINNDGGAIFDLLPVDPAKRESLYQMPHGMQFRAAAQQFGLAYSAPQTLAQFEQVIRQRFASGEGSLLVEAIVPPQQAQVDLKRLKQQLKQRLSDQQSSDS